MSSRTEPMMSPTHVPGALRSTPWPITSPTAQLHFVPRTAGLRLLTFPCSPSGQVEIDGLSAQDRIDYLFARALRGRDYAFPVVVRLGA